MGPHLFLVFVLISGTMAAAVNEILQDQDQADFVLEDLEPDLILDDDDLKHHRHEHDTTLRPVAFSALYNNEITKAGDGQHMKFLEILLNDGDGYDHHTGLFRAPVCGVYSFTYVIASHNRDYVNASLVVEGKRVNSAYAKGYYSNIEQGTNTAIVHLHKNEQVWVELGQGSTIEDEYSLYNSFSGFLMYTRE